MNISMQEYLAIQAMSSGMAHRLATQSPLHAWVHSPWNPNRPYESSNEADIGTVAHAAILEGNLDFVEVIDPEDHPAEKTGNIPDGWTNKSIRAARDAAIAAGKTPILKPDMPAIEAMVESALDYVANSELDKVFQSGEAETTLIWEERGVRCKARPDWLNGGTCLHLKTTKRSVRPEAFERLAINMGYDTSLAFYARGTIATLDHVILAVEQEPPYACKWFRLSPQKMAMVQRRIDRALDTWRVCLERNEFPAYDGSVHTIEPQTWEMERALKAGDMDDLSWSEREELAWQA